MSYKSAIPPTISAEDLCLKKYGPTAPKQFRIKSAKYSIPLPDVIQHAVVVIFERESKYDPKKGSLAAYLWFSLNCVLKSEPAGPIRLTSSLDDGGCVAEDLLQTLSSCVDEESLIPIDVYLTHDRCDPMLLELLKLAESISGMSYAEVAVLWDCTIRTVRNRIAKKVKEAEAYLKRKK